MSLDFRKVCCTLTKMPHKAPFRKQALWGIGLNPRYASCSSRPAHHLHGSWAKAFFHKIGRQPFAAVRSCLWPWVTPRISRGAVLAVMAFSFARWRGKSAPRRERCSASVSVPCPACFGLTPRSLAVWARVVSVCSAARRSLYFSICLRVNLRPCCTLKSVFFLIAE